MLEFYLVCWECSETSLLMRFQTNHIANVSWNSYLVGSNNALYIYPMVLELSVKYRVYAPGPNF